MIRCDSIAKNLPFKTAEPMQCIFAKGAHDWHYGRDGDVDSWWKEEERPNMGIAQKPPTITAAPTGTGSRPVGTDPYRTGLEPYARAAYQEGRKRYLKTFSPDSPAYSYWPEWKDLPSGTQDNWIAYARVIMNMVVTKITQELIFKEE